MVLLPCHSPPHSNLPHSNPPHNPHNNRLHDVNTKPSDGNKNDTKRPHPSRIVLSVLHKKETTALPSSTLPSKTLPTTFNTNEWSFGRNNTTERLKYNGWHVVGLDEQPFNNNCPPCNVLVKKDSRRQPFNNVYVLQTDKNKNGNTGN